MKIEVNVEKKYVFLIVGAILLLGGMIFAFAYGTSNPTVFGHSLGELFWGDPIPSSVEINGGLTVGDLGGEGQRMVVVGEDGTLESVPLPGSTDDTRVVVYDEFIGGPSLAWTESDYPHSTSGLVFVDPSGSTMYSRPGIVRTSGTGASMLSKAVHSSQFFDVTFSVRSAGSYTQKFSTFRDFSGLTVGLFSEPTYCSTCTSTNTQNTLYSAKIVFERRDGTLNNNWKAVTATSSSSKNVIDTGVATKTNLDDWVEFRIKRIDSNTISFYIDGVNVANSTSNIPNDFMNIGIFIYPTGFAPSNVFIDYFRMEVSNLARPSYFLSF